MLSSERMNDESAKEADPGLETKEMPMTRWFKELRQFDLAQAAATIKRITSEKINRYLTPEVISNLMTASISASCFIQAMKTEGVGCFLAISSGVSLAACALIRNMDLTGKEDGGKNGQAAAG